MIRSFALSVAGAFLLAYGAGVPAGWFGPSNYSECVLDGMKGVTSDAAAQAIAGACRKKFADQPENKPSYEQLPARAFQKIEAKSYERVEDFIRLKIYNGNDDWRVVSLVVRFTNTTTRTHRDYASTQSRPNYDPKAWAAELAQAESGVKVAEGALPLSDYTFYFKPSESPEPLSVAIVSARGVRE